MFAAPKILYRSPSQLHRSNLSPLKYISTKTPIKRSQYNQSLHADLLVHSPSRYNNLLKRFKDLYPTQHASSQSTNKLNQQASNLFNSHLASAQRERSLKRLRRKIFQEGMEKNSTKRSRQNVERKMTPLSQLRLQNILRKGIIRKLDFEAQQSNNTSSKNLYDGLSSQAQAEQSQQQLQADADKALQNNAGTVAQGVLTSIEELNESARVRPVTKRKTVSQSPPAQPPEEQRKEKLRRRNSLLLLYSPQGIKKRLNSASADEGRGSKSTSSLKSELVDRQQRVNQNIPKKDSNTHKARFATVKTATIQLSDNNNSNSNNNNNTAENSANTLPSKSPARSGDNSSSSPLVFTYVPTFFTPLRTEQIQQELSETKRQRRQKSNNIRTKNLGAIVKSTESLRQGRAANK